jgi:[acyl-carrier-protein] S-malonyltransferase
MHQDNYTIVFPGQGSQSVGMLKDLALNSPEIQETYREASDVLGYDLWDLVQNGPEEKLNKTEFTQPALLAGGIAVLRVWSRQNKFTPKYLAGHSLGEYTALVAAGVLDFQDAIKLVAARGRFMQEAYPEGGAMVAIVGLTDENIKTICENAARGEVLSVANYNSIGQTVLAGSLSAANRAVELAKGLGAKIVKILPVSIPSHSVLMKPAEKKLSQIMQTVTFNPPTIPVVQNSDVTIYDDPQQIRDALLRQLSNPVRWVETIQLMITHGVKSILECGPGKVLTGLNKRISNEIVVDSILNFGVSKDT